MSLRGGHIPRKRFGQNFLNDAGVIADIVRAVAPAPTDRLLEIGPGLGALTAPLAAMVTALHVVELDRDLAQRLREVPYARTLRIHEADVLTVDLAAFGPALRVVGNLPYNISSSVLFRLAACADALQDIHVMLQREVVDRMTADPGDSEYSRLSVMLQYHFAMEKLLDVPPESFDPPPRVHSAVVRLLPLRPLPVRACDEAVFARVVAQAFGQRRKTLRNSLAGTITAEALSGLGIDPGARAQTLPVAAFVRIADAVAGVAA